MTSVVSCVGILLLLTAISAVFLMCEGQTRDNNKRSSELLLYGSSLPNLGPPVVTADEYSPSISSKIIRELPGQPLNPIEVNKNLSPQGATPSESALSKVGRAVAIASRHAAEPLPPRFEPLPELGPQRMWQPTWQGCAPTFVDAACEFFYPAPRLWATDLDELQFRRSLLAGQDNLFEPVRARQSWVQLLSAEARSKKDKYTRAAQANDISSSTCVKLASQAPEYVSF